MPQVRFHSVAGTTGCPAPTRLSTSSARNGATRTKSRSRIDYITSQGEKDKLTAAAEAQAGTGHDIMSHRDWNIRIHQAHSSRSTTSSPRSSRQYGPISPVAEYLAKIKGAWRGVPDTAVGSQVKPCCSRLDLYKEHAGIDLRTMFPADESKWDKAKIDTWTWDAYLDVRREAASRPASRSACRWARPATPSTGSARLFNAYGVVMVDAKDNIKINSDETRRRWNTCKKLMEASPPEVYAWDDAGNNRWLISGKGSGIMNPPSAWAVAKRDNPKVAEQLLDASDAERTEGPLRRRSFRSSTACGTSRRTSRPQRTFCSIISQKESVAQLVEASIRLRSARPSRPCTISTPGRPSARRSAPSTATRRAATSRPRSFGAPARSEVGAQIYNQAINTVMVSKFTQGNEKLDDVIKWAEKELEGTLRA